MTDKDEPDLKSEINRIEELIATPKKRTFNAADQNFKPYVKPKFAATMILLDRDSKSPKVLMGRRNKNLKFMPGALVFPGGSVDRSDGSVKAAGELDPVVEHRVTNALASAGTRRRARGLAMAAIREVAEESGLLIGNKQTFASQHDNWADFAARGITPTLSGLRLFARAITPPVMARRFDTWFFVGEKSSVGHIPDGGFEPDGELEELQWITPEDAIGGPTREITRVLLVELMERLKADPGLAYDYPAPMYRNRHGSFTRSLI